MPTPREFQISLGPDFTNGEEVALQKLSGELHNLSLQHPDAMVRCLQAFIYEVRTPDPQEVTRLQRDLLVKRLQDKVNNQERATFEELQDILKQVIALD